MFCRVEQALESNRDEKNLDQIAGDEYWSAVKFRRTALQVRVN